MTTIQFTLRYVYATCIASLVRLTSAQEPRCTTESDNYVGNANHAFSIPAWIRRSLCIRSDVAMCYPALLGVLNNLNELRKAIYGSAAGALALLPTIGALKLGTTTDEVWTLLNVIPVGGALAMALSFGGTIMPMRAEDYTHVLEESKATIRIPYKKTHDARDDPGLNDALHKLKSRIEARMVSHVSHRVPSLYLIVGLIGMVVLLIGAQVAMIIVELGGVLSWWCDVKWWIHFWYLTGTWSLTLHKTYETVLILGLATLTAIMESLIRLPFRAQYKFYVSDVPYQITLQGNDSVIGSGGSVDCESVRNALRQARTLQFASLTIADPRPTKPRNSVLVVVSIVGHGRAFWQAWSRAANIAVFILGTFMFASVTLVPVPMALLLLALVLSASVFSRAIVGWLVRGVSIADHLIHVITEDEASAYHAATQIFAMRLDSHVEGEAVRKLQVEIDGNVFVDGRRVSKRSSWYVRVLGVLTEPYDLLLTSRGSSGGTRISEDGFEQGAQG
jgi:hypothetical protein